MTANIGSSTVESSTNEMPRKALTKASEHRRITKPIMEKKRRARINNSLNELKVLILDALNKDPSRHSKLEKADILEMTVRHLQKLQRQQVASSISSDSTVLNKYRAGFSECATEVNRCMGGIDGVDQSLRQRILSHLNHCVNSLNQMPSGSQFGLSQKSAFPGLIPTSSSALHVQIPMHSAQNLFGANSFLSSTSSSDINNNSFLSQNLCSSPVDLKPSLSTPPSSASSTSSHFAFNLNLHSPPLSKSVTMPLSLASSDIFYHKQLSSLSPGSSSFSSEQLSPVGSEDMDMAVDCTMSRKNGDDVWRPW